MNPKKILFAVSEAVPFAKSGGMADVCGSLPKALKERGYDVRVVMPRYWCINEHDDSFTTALGSMGVPMGYSTIWCRVLEKDQCGIKYYFIDHEGYFGRTGLYDDGKSEYRDNAERFSFFSRASLQLCKDTGFRPDIIHCNDWQTALIPAYIKIREKSSPFFSNTATVLTLHNIGYQGVFPKSKYAFTDLGRENFTESKFESWGKVHFLKGGIFYSDSITTVSPSYADEILTPEGGMGLAPYLERRKHDLFGILNGADYDHWDPQKDTLIPANYSLGDIGGKKICKKTLQNEFHLKESPDIPVIGLVTRLTHQKGLDILRPVIRAIVKNMTVQFAILGSGKKHLENFFGGLPSEMPGSVGAWIGFNNHKAHLIEAGSDLFLMPSLYEPCGLNQIYSMKYGTLPIVRNIGGLKDTVTQYDESTGKGTGFKFHSNDPQAVYYTTGWAVSTYFDRPHHFKKMMSSAMNTNFSWKRSSSDYEQVYKKALARRKTWA